MEVEGVFLISAASRDVFFNRKTRLEEITGFSDGGFDSGEEDEDGGAWKVILTGDFESIEELKASIKKMEKYEWLYLHDSTIMDGYKYLFDGGEWHI